MSDRATVFPLADGSGVYVKAPPRRAAWLRADAGAQPSSRSDPAAEIRGMVTAATRGVVKAWDPETGDLHARTWERSSDPQEDAHRELVEMAKVPLRFSEVENLDEPKPDTEVEREIEQFVQETRERAFIKKLAAALAPEIAAQRRRERKRKPKATPPTIFDGELTSGGWRWARARSVSSFRLRARLRR